jgi:DNA-binding IclR family transcriptional regulator
MGRVLLAALSPLDQKADLERVDLQALTPRTVTDRVRLR